MIQQLEYDKISIPLVRGRAAFLFLNGCSPFGWTHL